MPLPADCQAHYLAVAAETLLDQLRSSDLTPGAADRNIELAELICESARILSAELRPGITPKPAEHRCAGQPCDNVVFLRRGSR
ncbi:hypothetical protein DXT96_08915 [Agrobacterium sp. ICMP 6402]|nr:hypothetical protein [Agrobacterium sp. ICMP 6402]